MSEIVPTITAMTPNEYAEAVEKLSFAPRLHIDVTDGEFASSRTINLNQIYWGKDKTIDLHLMIKRPSEWLHQIVALHPNLVILHAETENLASILDHLRKFDIRCGVALLPETTPEQMAEVIETIDHVLIFGGRLGYQGGTADLEQLRKVAEIRTINPHAEIAWDGGANAENIAEIATVGVDVINVGSAIIKTENPEKSFDKLARLC